MATKYLLVPEQLYRGLLNQEPDNINLDFERKLLEKTRKEKKTPDVKNVLYNQELRRYLKFKKEHDEKPVKVELKNGVKIISKKPKIRNNHPYTSSRSSTSSKSTITQEHLVDVGDEDPTVVQSQQTGSTTMNPMADTNLSSQRTPRAGRGNLNEQIERLHHIVLANPLRFHVNRDGNIVSQNGRIISNSNVMHSLERIVNPTTENMPTPPGTHRLRNALQGDPIASRILKGENTPIRSLPSFRPNIWQ